MLNTLATSFTFGVITLLSLALAVWAIWAKQKAENQSSAKLEEAGAKLSLFPKLEAKIEELQRKADELNIQLSQAKDLDRTREQEIRNLSSELATTKSVASSAEENAKRQIADLKSFIEDSKDQLQTAFANTANESLSKVVKQFEEQTAGNFKLREQRLDGIVLPLQQRMDLILKRCESSDAEILKAKDCFETQLRGLEATTNGLVNALKRPDIRGDWGEMALQNALDFAGLKEGLHYRREHTTKDNDERRRADIVVSLPKGEKLVIDSKAPFSTYDEAMNAEPAERKAFVDKHAKSLRNHISALAGKEYHSRYQGPDFVIMFLPHEGMLLAALEADSRLIEFASERKVYIATPITLSAALGAVGHLVRIEQLNQNAEEIKKTGQDLYSAIAIFAEHYDKVGRGLGTAVNAFNRSVGTMESRLIKSASKLKELGIAGRDMPDVSPLEVSRRTFSKPELLVAGKEEIPT